MLHSNQPDTKSLIIREAHSGDLPVLERFSPRFPGKHHGRIEKQKNRESQYLIAMIHGKHVAHVDLLLKGVEEEAVRSKIHNCPAIEDIYVDKLYRSRGIGTKLIQECIKRVKEKGYHQIGLAVGTENVKAKQLYHRLGFYDSGVPEYYVEQPYIDPQTNEAKKEGEMCRFLIKHL